MIILPLVRSRRGVASSVLRGRVHARTLPITAAADPAPPRFKHAPKTIYANEGEQFLFQFGEGLATYALPEGTRVIYPGVRRDGEKNLDKIEAMICNAFDNPIGTEPLRIKLRKLKESSASPKVVMAFDDVSIPLPPMRSPDIRHLIMDLAERYCIEEGVTDITFICSIALHRYIRPDEFRHLCGPRLFDKYFPQGAITAHVCMHAGSAFLSQHSHRRLSAYF